MPGPLNDKVAVNGVDLLNRHELSTHQNHELQRYIDNHNHLLSFKDREVPEPILPAPKSASQYSQLSKRLGGSSGSDVGYQTLDKCFPGGKMERTATPVYREIGVNSLSSAQSSPRGYDNHSNDYSSGYGSVKSSDAPQYESVAGNSTPQYGNVTRTVTGGQGRQRSYSNNFDAPPAPRGRSNSQNFDGNSLRRKNVSWSDSLEGCGNGRARSASPSHQAHFHSNTFQPKQMSQYGSSGHINRGHTASPAYSNMSTHRDNYNRFETQRHRESSLSKHVDDGSRFSGYGDRPGSGVEMSSHHWDGGEIITSRDHLPKMSIKPRRMFYSPIGDGVVAADGVEMKRGPVDLTPKVTITELQHVERGSGGRGGVNIYEKNWTDTMGSGAPMSDGGFSDFGGPGNGRDSRASAISPLGGEPYPRNNNGLGAGAGPGAGTGKSPYGNDTGRSPYDNGNHGGVPASPYSTLGRSVALPNYGTPTPNHLGSNGNLGDPTGRMSAASSMFSDPNAKITTETGYLITNPRELIHQYATMTPVAVMDPSDHTPTTASTKISYKKETRNETTTEHREFLPMAPYRAHQGPNHGAGVVNPNKFVRQLRDENLTETQRIANTHLDQLNNRDPNSSQRIEQIRRETSGRVGGNDDIDALTQQMLQGLATSTPVPSRY